MPLVLEGYGEYPIKKRHKTKVGMPTEVITEPELEEGGIVTCLSDKCEEREEEYEEPTMRQKQTVYVLPKSLEERMSDKFETLEDKYSLVGIAEQIGQPSYAEDVKRRMLSKTQEEECGDCGEILTRSNASYHIAGMLMTPDERKRMPVSIKRPYLKVSEEGVKEKGKAEEISFSGVIDTLKSSEYAPLIVGLSILGLALLKKKK